MAQYQGVFKRYEKKYLLSAEQYSKLRLALAEYMAVDKYGKTAICNIYFDTPEHLLIRRSLEKPVYKEKLRLRSYETPGADDTVFIELKKKYKGVVYKRRVAMNLKNAKSYLTERISPDPKNQILKEIDWFMDEYSGIAPAMVISYDRVAMYGREDPELRITFDSNILWREEELLLEKGIYGTPLLEPGERLMEIKIAGAMPIWLCHLLDELEIFPRSFSKYGKAYINSLCENKFEKGLNYSA